MSTTTIRIVTESEEFERLKEVWDSVLRQCKEDSSMYLTHEWVWTWWKHFGEGKKLNILLIERKGRVIAIIPLMKVDYKIGFVRLRLLETIGSTNCNYVGLILGQSQKEAIIALLAYLERESVKNKLILRLTLVPEDSSFLDLLRTHRCLVSQTLCIHEKLMTLAPYLRLPATWDEYFGSLSQRRRQTLRRALRSLENGHTIEFKHFATDTLEEGLNQFFDLHQARWKSINVRGVFSNPKVKDFYREIASQFIKKDWLYFSCLSVDGKMVSATFGFVYNQKLYAATDARDIRYSEYSVGHLHTMYSIQDAINKQLQEFDFLRGDEPYKFHWTKSSRKYVQIIMLEKDLWFGLKLKSLYAFLRLYEMKQYRLRELYSLYRRKRKEQKDKERMGMGRIGSYVRK